MFDGVEIELSGDGVILSAHMTILEHSLGVLHAYKLVVMQTVCFLQCMVLW